LLCTALKWKSQRTLTVVGLAGLLHDVGFRALPTELSLKARDQMTTQELAVYETHPVRGAELLKIVPGIPHEVISIVEDHHEEPYGKGFPQHKDVNRIYPLSRIIFIADHMAHRLIQSSKDPNPLTPDQIFKSVKLYYGSFLTPELVRAIALILNVHERESRI
jgi:HD-GYP domain-containing protein (c-di-GMP phosphodiesterase class II)